MVKDETEEDAGGGAGDIPGHISGGARRRGRGMLAGRCRRGRFFAYFLQKLYFRRHFAFSVCRAGRLPNERQHRGVSQP